MGVAVIELVRPPRSADADAIATALQAMVVAFREIEDPSRSGPLLRDGDDVAEGTHDIADFLDRLRRDLRLWNAFQSDACFIDDDGEIC